MQSITSPNKVLKFWFEDTEAKFWFKKSQAFDASIREYFEFTIQAAHGGQLHSWANHVEGCVALILILDQFTRNIYRNTPAAFAGDTQALELSLDCVKRHWIGHKNPDYRHFMLMPMMHSEDLAIQDRALPLFKEHTDERTHAIAVKHHGIIARFGRYPHRNAILGRKSSDEEIKFLQEPGSSF